MRDWMSLIEKHNIKLQPVLRPDQSPEFWAASVVECLPSGINVVPNNSPFRTRGRTPQQALSRLLRIINQKK